MTSFGKGALLCAVLVGTFGASAAAFTVDADLERQVKTRIAQRWRVPREAVQVEWGYFPASLRVAGKKSLRLVGKGTDGWLAVVIQTAEGHSAAVRVRAGVVDTTEVAARPVSAGAYLQADDMRKDPRVVWGPPGRRRETPAVGWKVRRDLSPGDALVPPAVESPPLVKAGATVRLEWSHGAVHIAFTGVAVNSARRGETVRVHVLGRHRPVCGIAAKPGVVELQSGGTR